MDNCSGTKLYVDISCPWNIIRNSSLLCTLSTRIYPDGLGTQSVLTNLLGIIFTLRNLISLHVLPNRQSNSIRLYESSWNRFQWIMVQIISFLPHDTTNEYIICCIIQFLGEHVHHVILSYLKTYSQLFSSWYPIFSMMCD